MKLFLAVALLIAAVSADLLTDVDKAKIQSFSDSCIASTHVTKETVLKMRTNKFENDQHLKDYLFCIFKKMGWQSEDGTFNKDNVNSFVSKDSIAEEAMKPCIGEHGSTGPETAFIVFKCYKQNLPAGFKTTL